MHLLSGQIKIIVLPSQIFKIFTNFVESPNRLCCGAKDLKPNTLNQDGTERTDEKQIYSNPGACRSTNHSHGMGHIIFKY